MPLDDVADQYFTYESRLTSFQTAQPLSKRRISNATSKAPKSIKWPHHFLSAEDLAKAGFFYYPTQANPDNVVCFLCHKSLDGWEEDDDPLVEHLKHSSDCGWAIVAAIERQDGDFSEEYPASARMIDARKATFADKWPHESKKGWKCKTKQMVDAGWKYTPTPEYDDTATCTYCSLALDGWELADKPLDEHYKRSPDCPFFSLSNENKHNSARKSKAKRDRSSKASRLSTQSIFTATSEVPSVADLPIDEDDTVLTIATNATATPAEKKMDKRKRTTTGKGRKTKAKKSEAVEIDPSAEPEDNNLEVREAPAPKATRGRKRKSEQIHDSATDDVDPEAPAAKRRTRTRASTAVEDASLPAEKSTHQMDEPPSPAGPIRAKRVGRPSRKPSARVASKKVKAQPVPTDEEIDAALQADLDRPISEDGEKPVVLPSRKVTKSSKGIKDDHAMFDPQPMDIDEAAIEAELEAIEAESKQPPKPKAPRGRPRKASAKQQAAAKKAADAAEAEAVARDAADELASDQIASELELSISMQHSPPALKPKKQRAASRKVSKQVPARGTSASILSAHDTSIIQTDDLQRSEVDQNGQDNQKEDFGNDTNLSIASQSTVVRASTSTLRGSTMKKRGRPSKQRVASRNMEDIVQKSQGASGSGIGSQHDPPVATKEASPDEISMTEERFYTPAPEFHPEDEKRAPEVSGAPPSKPKGRPSKIASQPAAAMSITPLPKQEMKSQSPQSDIENQPPSSKPSTAKKSATPKPTLTRVPLADTTPARSPSKLSVISCLQSSNPWTGVDLDAIFLKTPSDENSMSKGLIDDAMAKLKNSELTSPEKKMSVEEWILYNAEIADQNLRNECERMVGIFEREGTRAMAALEGVDCTE